MVELATSQVARLLAGLGIGLLVVAGLISANLQPVDKLATTPILLRVEEGDSVAAVASQLDQKSLVRSPLLFRIIARLQNATIQPGLFHVAPADSPSEILALLSVGDPQEKQVTLLEGWRLEEVAARLAESGLVNSVQEFIEATQVTEATDPAFVAQFTLEVGDSLEGFLFPDTYRFATDSEATTIVNRMIQNFLRRTGELNVTYDDIVLASIVEREALFDEDRAVIAGVYTNRLEIGMKLDADPTVQYGKANELIRQCSDACKELEWWPTIAAADYDAVDSPYNTYRVNGLPSTPIASPGLASIVAATRPATHDYFYFLNAPDGTTYFGKTAADHQENKRRYLQ